MRPKRILAYSMTILGLLVLVVGLTYGQTDPYSQLRFAQVANGQSGQDYWVTTLIVTNSGSSALEILVESWEGVNDAGQPVLLDLGFKTTCGPGSGAGSYVPAPMGPANLKVAGPEI